MKGTAMRVRHNSTDVVGREPTDEGQKSNGSSLAAALFFLSLFPTPTSFAQMQGDPLGYDGPIQAEVDAIPLPIDAPDPVSENIQYNRVPATSLSPYPQPFVYTTSRVTRRIGLVAANESTLLASVPDGATSNPLIVECGQKGDFIPRDGYVHLTDVPLQWYLPNISGTESNGGYTRAALAHPCQIARRLEYEWHDAYVHGHDVWHSRNEHGRVQCYSLDETNCLDLNDMTEAQIQQLYQGHDEAYSSIPSRWAEHMPTQVGWPMSRNLNSDLVLRLIARPAVCTQALENQDGHWCNDLSKPESSYRQHARATQITLKKGHMQETINRWEEHELAKIDEELDFYNQYNNYQTAYVHNLAQYQQNDCQYLWDNWDAPMSNYALYYYYDCDEFKEQYESAFSARDALDVERGSRQQVVYAQFQYRRSLELHKLHEQLAAEDGGHFAVLLRIESEELEELQQLQEFYKADAQEKQQVYEQVVNQYMSENGPTSLVNDVLDLPIMPPFLKQAVEFGENPTRDNLRDIVVSSYGPLLGPVEGSLEVVGGSGYQKPDGYDEGLEDFFADLWDDIINNHDLVAALEDLAIDAWKDWGAGFIDEMRAIGLYQDGDNETKRRSMPWYSLAQFKSELSRVSRGGVDYDPWLMDFGASDPWFNQESVKRFKKKFSASSGIVSYLDNPNLYDTSDSQAVRLASQAAQFLTDIEKIFIHSMGKQYRKVIWEQNQVSRTTFINMLFEVLTHPVYSDMRTPRWATTRDIGMRHAAFVYTRTDAVIVLNRDLLGDTQDLGKYYFEELGHMLNWWRCRLFDLDISLCDLGGDPGARFRDAVLLDDASFRATASDTLATGSPDFHYANRDQSAPSFSEALHGLPSHVRVDPEIAVFGLFNGVNEIGWIEGYPNVVHFSEHLSGGVGSFVARAEISAVNGDLPMISDSASLDVVITGYLPFRKDTIFAGSAGTYCDDVDGSAPTECDRPTMFVDIGLRDLLDLSFSNMPQYKDSQYVEVSPLDLHLSYQGKHGLRLAFQMNESDDRPRFMGWDQAIFYKYQSIGPTLRLDFWKTLKLIGANGIKNGKALWNKGNLEFATPPKSSWPVGLGSQQMVGWSGVLQWEVPNPSVEDMIAMIGIDATLDSVGCYFGVAAVDMIGGEGSTVTGCHIGEIVGDVIAGLIEQGVLSDMAVSVGNGFFFMGAGPEVDIAPPGSFVNGGLKFRFLVDWGMGKATVKEGSLNVPDVTSYIF